MIFPFSLRNFYHFALDKPGVFFSDKWTFIEVYETWHETYPSYHNKQVVQVIENAVRWTCQRVNIPDSCPNVEPLETISSEKSHEGDHI
jgi:trehalose utilization protein